MHIQLLGPVQIVAGPGATDERDGPVSGVRRKSVLAVLALHPGQVVTTDRLVEAVWGEDPPAAAHNTLQRHISYLRSLLPAGAVTTHAATGYSLSLTGESTDLQAFQRHLARASDTTDPETAARELTVALAGVRGAPLADVRSVEQLDRHAVRLEEQILAAREALARARLGSGSTLRSSTSSPASRPSTPSRRACRSCTSSPGTGAGSRRRRSRHTARPRHCWTRSWASSRARGCGRSRWPCCDRTPRCAHPPGPRGRAAEPPARTRCARRFPSASLSAATTSWPALVALLDSERVATVVGTGGVGKTSLVVRACAAVKDSFPGGCGWADLAAVEPGGGMPGGHRRARRRLGGPRGIRRRGRGGRRVRAHAARTGLVRAPGHRGRRPREHADQPMSDPRRAGNEQGAVAHPR